MALGAAQSGWGPSSGMAASANAGAAAAVTTKSAVEVRKDFPETWLFGLEVIG